MSYPQFGFEYSGVGTHIAQEQLPHDWLCSFCDRPKVIRVMTSDMIGWMVAFRNARLDFAVPFLAGFLSMTMALSEQSPEPHQE